MPFHTDFSDLPIAAAGKTDVGCVRTNNEDNFGYDAALGIFVLCDGMGGQAAGEVASELSVNAVLAYLRQGPGGDEFTAFDPSEGISEDAHRLRDALRAANQAVRDAIAADEGRDGMGTTVVAALLRGKKAAIAHVGDSRVYLIREHTIEQVTQDHSLVMEQVRRGLITLEDAANSPIQNIITRALGVAETVEVDVSEHELAEGDTARFRRRDCGADCCCILAGCGLRRLDQRGQGCRRKRQYHLPAGSGGLIPTRSAGFCVNGPQTPLRFLERCTPAC